MRSKVYNSQYWKEHCFALTAESLVDRAVELRYVCGTYGSAKKPSEFICLVLKMLQLQPDKEIIIEFIKNEEYKYVRILGAFYLRLVGRPLEVYQYLEPLYNDNRKVRLRTEYSFELSHVDELVDDMLRKDYCFDIALPRLPARMYLEKQKLIEPRISLLEDDFDEEALEAEANEAAQAAAALEREMAEEERRRAGSPDRAREPDRERKERDRDREKERDRDREKERVRDGDREKDRAREKDRPRDRDLERDREKDRDRDQDRGRDRDRDRDRGRDDRDRDRDERKRHRSPSADRKRDKKERERDRDRDRDRNRDRDRDRRDQQKKEKDRDRHRDSRDAKKKRVVDDEAPDIVAANEMRAKLGLKPLR